MFRIIKVEDYKVTNWAAGSTTELFIYPENASFAERKFLFRLSRATVEEAESTFTALPGVTRWIMPLDGRLHLEFKNDGQNLYHIDLEPFQPHCFKGEWHTKSVGKVSDFNLMMKDRTRGEMTRFVVPANQTLNLATALEPVATAHRRIYALYMLKGSLDVASYVIESGETGILQSDTSVSKLMVTALGDESAEMILVQMIF